MLTIPRSEMEVDGSLRDIYVYDIDTQTWNRFLRAVRESNYVNRLVHADQELSLKDVDLQTIRHLQETDSVSLYIQVSNQVIAICHFFADDELELDIDPQELGSSKDYTTLLEFLRWLADALRHTVHLTHENRPENEILRIEPSCA